MGFGREVDPVTRLASLPLLGEVLLDPNWLLTRLSLTAPLPVVGAETLAHYKHIYTNRPGAKAYHLALVRQGVGLGGQRISFTATQLAALRRPALVICGGADALFPPLHGQRAAALLRAALHVRPGVGHNLPMEDSEAVARLVLEFAAKAFGG
jgi:pimeloyl-ACP methyl ester carboxylesterase